MSAETKVTMLGPKLARIERRGHTAEGMIEWTDTGMSFDGHFVCGPHDEEGNHTRETRRR